MRGLHSTIELHGISVDAFLAYKQRLIDYLENFISELVSSTGKIAATLAHLERCGLAAIAFPAAAHHETADLLDPAPDAREHALTRATARWNQRWDGIRRWFIPTGGSPSQSEHLRARARSAIPALLNAVTQINDRRSSRADRAADFSTLARWFAQAPPATRRATASGTPLSPSPPPITCASTTKPSPPAPRKTTPPRTGWLQAAPVWLSPRLRQYGQNAPRGTSHPVIDRSAEKQRLLEIAREQTAQIEQARLRLIHAGRVRLSELAPPHTPLADHPFRLLLELLGHALSQRPDRAGPIDVESTDGTLRIPLEPLPAATATLATHDGNFTGRDHWLTITHAHPATAHSAAPRRA
jgi:uncharacterized protein (TIGR02677 family)